MVLFMSRKVLRCDASCARWSNCFCFGCGFLPPSWSFSHGSCTVGPHVDQPVLWIPHEAQHGVDRGVGIRPIKVHRGHEALDVVDGGMDASGVVAMGVETGTLVTCLLMTVGVLTPLFFVERELKAGPPFVRSGGVRGLAVGLSVAMLITVLKPITHDGSEPERTVCGTLEHLSWSVQARCVFAVAQRPLPLLHQSGIGHGHRHRPVAPSADGARNLPRSRGPTCRAQLVWVRGACSRSDCGSGHALSNGRGAQPLSRQLGRVARRAACEV